MTRSIAVSVTAELLVKCLCSIFILFYILTRRTEHGWLFSLLCVSFLSGDRYLRTSSSAPDCCEILLDAMVECQPCIHSVEP